MNSSFPGLKKEEEKVREELYKRCVPYLEKLIEVSPTNLDALRTLRNIYSVLGDNEGFKEVSAQINELEG